jgi:sulfur carrier protein
MITVRMEPGGEVKTFAQLNTVQQLLNRLGLRHTEALVIRGGRLLTQDLKLNPDDALTVRVVVSAG